MNSKPQEQVPAQQGSNSNRAARRPFLIGAVAVSLATCCASLLLLPRGPAPIGAVESNSAAAKSEQDTPQPEELNRRSLQTAKQDGAGTAAHHERIAEGTATPAPGPTPVPEPSAETRQLVNALVLPATALSHDQAVQWKQNLQRLIGEGAGAVPALREFLARNVDVDFGPEGSQLLGYSSVRTALIDALQQIGGPEALSAMLHTLQTTSDPREIALLARALETQDPERFRQESINATREALSMARDGKLDGRDVGPLFEVLQKFGGAAAVSDLEQATDQWKYYATLSLAQLPDGAGIPTLIQMARDPASAAKGTLSVALEMLARVAPQYPEARSALIDQARRNLIPANLWPYVASSLTGEQYQYLDSVFGSPTGSPSGGDLKTIHVNFGNQNLFSSAGAGDLSPDQINQQVSLIDELLSANKDSTAATLLQQSREALLKRLSQLAAVVLPGQ